MSIRKNEPGKQEAPPITVRDADVLCGRGKVSFNHAGNKRFQALVKESRTAFSEAAKNRFDRLTVVESVIESINNSGGRFLKEDVSTGQWSVLTDKEAKAKVGHAIRDSIKFLEKGGGGGGSSGKALVTFKTDPNQVASATATTAMPQQRRQPAPAARPMQPGFTNDDTGGDRKLPASESLLPHLPPLQHPRVTQNASTLLHFPSCAWLLPYLPEQRQQQQQFPRPPPPPSLTATATTLENIPFSLNQLANRSDQNLARMAPARALTAPAPDIGTVLPSHRRSLHLETGQCDGSLASMELAGRDALYHSRGAAAASEPKRAPPNKADADDDARADAQPGKERDKQQQVDPFMETINSVLGPLPPDAEDPLKPFLEK